MSSASTDLPAPDPAPPSAAPASAEPPDSRAPIVLPTHDDVDIADSSSAVGGPVGARPLPGRSWWGPIRIAVIVAVIGYALAVLARMPCVTSGFAGVSRYTHMCYSDIPVLYHLRGFADGYLPYLDSAPDLQPFEYPVLTGAMAQLAAWLTPRLGGGSIGFYAVNVVLIGALLIATVWATALTAGRRPWDGVLVACAPALLLTSTINWDMLPVALVAASLLLWARRIVFWAGVVLGLAIAAKFYPLILLGPLLILCLRAGKLGAFGRFTAGAALAWIVANVPVMVVNFEGWANFYTFSSARGQDFGSPWLALSLAGFTIPAGALNLVGLITFAVLCLGLAVVMLAAPTRPRLAPMLFCVLAAFALTNKVYSPQYVIWLVPLAVLALPRVRYLVAWQAGELIYFAAIWLYLAGLEQPGKGLPAGWYSVAIWIHVGATAAFCAMLLWITLRPDRDPLRGPGAPPGADSAGGVLDGAPDRWRLRLGRTSPIQAPTAPTPAAT
ncbi:MAG: glycosyltransferase family 87 protein [Candidatus Nanopelagicales bacterium]